MGLNPFQKITVLEEALKEKDVVIQKAEKDKECLKIIVKKQSVEIRRLQDKIKSVMQAKGNT